jgi:predicted acyltransferase (DUF342 family)
MVAGMLALPLIPSLVELRTKSDAQPLSVIQEHAGEIRHFATSFRTYIAGLQQALQQCVDTGTTAHGVLPDGCEYLIWGRPSRLPDLPTKQKACDLVIVAGTEFITPEDTTFSREIYAAEKFSGGEGSTYRAVLGEKNIHLGPDSRVMRWIHAVGDFSADQNCELYGRISADCTIRLGANTQFLRLNAPRIELGSLLPGTEKSPLESEVFPPAQPRIVHRLLCEGDFEIAEGEVVSGSVVARGRLLIRSGARVCGSAKSHHEMILEPGVTVDGSLISASTMRIGPNCAIHGPVIAEREIKIAAGTCCGSFDLPTTISSPRVQVQEGVIVFGTLWARESGRIVAQL